MNKDASILENIICVLRSNNKNKFDLCAEYSLQLDESNPVCRIVKNVLADSKKRQLGATTNAFFFEYLLKELKNF